MREISHKYKYIFSRATTQRPQRRNITSKQIIFSGPIPGRVSGFTWTCAPTRKAGGSETASGGGKAKTAVYFNIIYVKIR